MHTCSVRSLLRFALPLLSAILCGTAACADVPKMFGSIPEIHIIGRNGMVPLQPTIDLLIDTTWSVDKETGKITVNFPKDYTFTCTLNKLEAQLNGKDTKLPTAPFEHLGVIYVPSETLALACKGTAKVDGKSMLVDLSFDGPDGIYAITLPYNTLKMYPSKEKFDDSDTELYVVATDGQGQRRLSYNTYPDELPVFPPGDKPDSLRIIYQRGGKIYIRDVKNRNETAVLKIEEPPVPGGAPNVPPPPPPQPPPGGGGPGAMLFMPGGTYLPECVTPDGNALIFTQWYGPMAAMTGGNIISCNLTGNDPPKQLMANASSPCLSPDGKFLAYTAHMGPMTTIAVIDPTNPTTPRMVGEGEKPMFSPTGRSILYTRTYNDGGKTFKRMIIYVSQGGKQPLVFAPEKIDPTGGDEIPGGFSPDAKLIVYSCNTGISTMSPDRKNPKQITTNEKDSCPQFTPDGTQIVFLRGTDLHIMSADGNDVKQLTNGIKVLQYRIIPGGKQIFFTARPEEPATGPQPQVVP